MNSARITPLDPPYDSDVARRFAAVMPPDREPLKLFRTVARNKRVLERLFAGALLDRGTFSLAEREIVILRTCARCSSEYEWGVHVRIFADRARLTESQVAATVRSDANATAWSPEQALLIRLVDELHDTETISDALWGALRARWSEEQLIELVALVGYYHTISFVTNAFRIEFEPDAARFPPGPS